MFKTKPILLQEGDQVSTRVQLLRVSTIQHGGETVVIDSKLLTQLKKNFDEKVRGYPDGQVPIDYFHDNDKIAAGWIKSLSLENSGTELWADVKWTPKGEEVIKNGELRYLSIEYHPNYEDAESGKQFGPTVFGAGLTNRPAIKGMAPVAKFSEKQQSLADALSACVSDLIPQLIAQGHDQEQAIAIAYSKCGESKMAELKNAKKGYAEMTLEQAMAKIAELEKKIAEMQAAHGAGEAELAKAKEAAVKAEQEKAMAEKKASFDKMLSEGKAVEAQREPFMKGDMVKFSELAQATNPGRGSSSTPTPTTFADAQDEVMAAAEKLMSGSKLSLREAISSVLHSNKALAEKYTKETSVRG